MRASAKLALLGLVALLLVSSVASGVVKSAGYNDVQIFVTTSAQLQYSYTFTAYNSTGSQVATYQGNYPAGAFELPSGVYLFTVSAVLEGGISCYLCPVYTGTATSTATASSGSPYSETAQGTYSAYTTTTTSTGTRNGSTGDGNSTTMPIYKIYQPKSEYGWAAVDVTSSQTLNINLMNVTQFPTSQVTVRVSFENGTVAAGAWVSASVVGQWYYWWADGSSVSMSAQTGTDGTAALTIPAAPVIITAWDWVSVNLPPNQTNTVNVGGQKVNVTEIWGPAYVGLSGSANLIPPASAVDIVLHYQQPAYWAEPASAQTAPATSGDTTSGTVASAPSGVPSQVRQTTSSVSAQDLYYQPTRIGALGALEGPSNGSQLFGGSLPVVAAAVAVVAMTVLAALVLARRKRPPAPAL